MASERIEATVSEAEMIAFGQKLAEWAGTITPMERAILGELVARAAYTAEHDVQGYNRANQPLKIEKYDNFGRNVPSDYVRPGIPLPANFGPTLFGVLGEALQP